MHAAHCCRSLSVGDSRQYSLGPLGAGAANASDAVESLLLLGQRPVLSGENQVLGEQFGQSSHPDASLTGLRLRRRV